MEMVPVSVILVIFLSYYCVQGQWGGNTANRILLTDVSAITLRNGQMTTHRRTSAVPQLKCLGGTAGCQAFTPEVVQCYNRGSDGVDVQWECKTDMDNRYKFGKIEVVCEGYDSSQDPYILKGSCGMEYELDLTKEGYERKSSGSEFYSASKPYPQSMESKRPSLISWIFLICVIAFVYQLYKSCVAQRQYSRTDDDHPQGPDHRSFRSGGRGSGPSAGTAPYPSDFSSYPGEGCSGTQAPPAAGLGRPGFWSGLGAGAGLGYLFGRNRPGGGWFGGNTGYGYGGGQGWFSGGYGGQPAYSPGYSGSSSSFSSSSGSREASGFGGTRRR